MTTFSGDLLSAGARHLFWLPKDVVPAIYDRHEKTAICETINDFGYTVGLVQGESLAHWQPAQSQDGAIRLFCLGRPLLEETHWNNWHGEPQFVTSFLLKTLLDEGIEGLTKHLTGAFSLLIIDRTREEITAITDPFGVRPIFAENRQNPTKLRLSTHQGLLAEIRDEIVWDKHAITQYLSYGYVHHPRTFYQQIQSLDAGSVYSWNYRTGKSTSHRYFDITPTRYVENKEELKERYLHVLSAAIRRRTVGALGRQVVFLSGGMDSRVIAAGAASKPSSVTLHSEGGRESTLAQLIAERLDLEHVKYQRDIDYYFRNLDHRAKIFGGMSALFNDHLGTYALEGLRPSIDGYLTGCLADWQLKGVSFNRARYKLANQPLPWFKLAPFKHRVIGSNIALGDDAKVVLDEALEEIWTHQAQQDPHIAAANRIWPAHQEQNNAMRLAAQRLMCWDTFASDRDVATLFTITPPKWLLNAEMYQYAVGKISFKLDTIPHSGRGIRLNSGPLSSFVQEQVYRVKRKVLKTTERTHPLADGSWGDPVFQSLNAPLTQPLWENVRPEVRDLCHWALGVDLWKMPKNDVVRRDKFLLPLILPMNAVL